MQSASSELTLRYQSKFNWPGRTIMAGRVLPRTKHKHNSETSLEKLVRTLSHNGSCHRAQNTSADPKPEGGTGGQPEGGRGQEESQERSPTKPARQGKASQPGEARGRREREPGAQGRKRPQGGEGARRPHPGRRRQQNRNSKNPCHLLNSLTHPLHRTLSQVVSRK